MVSKLGQGPLCQKKCEMCKWTSKRVINASFTCLLRAHSHFSGVLALCRGSEKHTAHCMQDSTCFGLKTPMFLNGTGSHFMRCWAVRFKSCHRKHPETQCNVCKSVNAMPIKEQRKRHFLCTEPTFCLADNSIWPYGNIWPKKTISGKAGIARWCQMLQMLPNVDRCARVFQEVTRYGQMFQMLPGVPDVPD